MNPNAKTPSTSKKSLSKIDISIVLCVHDEGLLVHHTLESIKRSIDVASRDKLATELIIVADAANGDTLSYLESIDASSLKFKLRTERVLYKSLGLSRNHGINLARGEFVTVIDGDDLMSGNWLTYARRLIVAKNKPIVVHPQYLFSFGAFSLMWKMDPSTSSHFSHAGSIEANYFCSPMMIRTDLARKNPYRRTDAKDVLGFEDWLWNSDTLHVGIEHGVATGTMYAYRRKKQGSMLSSMVGCLLPSTDYFRAASAPKSIKIGVQSSIIHQQKNRYLKRGTLSALTLLSRALFFALSPFRRIHHRVESYVPSLRDHTIYFFRPPGNPQSEVQVKNKVPGWLMNEINDLHYIDHRIFLSKKGADHINFYKPNPTVFTQLYWQMAKQIGDDCTHLMIVPWLKKGGADLEAINYTNAILQADPLAKVVVVSTENTDSPWAKRLDKRIKFIDFGAGATSIHRPDQLKLLATLCMQLQPKVIHLVNSQVGYDMLEAYAKPLSSVSKIYVQLFCFDTTSDGYIVHYFLDHMQSVIQYVTKVFTDNQKIIDEVVRIQALPRDKFVCHYQPMNIKADFLKPNKQKTYSHQDPLRVLWAGRLDTQKRPDLLLKIAEKAALSDLPVKFDAYGSQVLDGGDVVEKLNQSRLVSYKGGYDKGLASLNLKDYDMFLINSQWEGLPNVVLEAIMGGLPVLAADTGGIGEIIANKKTGYLVTPFDNIGSYISALKDAVKNPGNLEKYREEAYSVLKKRHNWDHFLSQVKDEKEYIQNR